MISTSLYIFAKSARSHIITLQSITPEGLIVDDPYGGHAADYRKGQLGDLFKGKDKGSEIKRSDPSLGFKNVPHYDKTEKDYTKRDFTAESGQNLQQDESRGNSELLKWEMITEATKEFINYYILYEKN